MARAIHTGGIRPVTLPNQYPPTPGVMAILSRFDRDQLSGFIAIAIDLADAMDGDPDVETNGDELDGTGGEDDFIDRGSDSFGGSGCPISDPPEENGDERDGNGSEEDFMYHQPNGIGCPLSDPGGTYGDRD